VMPASRNPPLPADLEDPLGRTMLPRKAALEEVGDPPTAVQQTKPFLWTLSPSETVSPGWTLFCQAEGHIRRRCADLLGLAVGFVVTYSG
jgi:hypothetical protein